MVLNFLKRSAHEKKQAGNKAGDAEAGPRPSTSHSTYSDNRPYHSHNPLALNPPNMLQSQAPVADGRTTTISFQAFVQTAPDPQPQSQQSRPTTAHGRLTRKSSFDNIFVEASHQTPPPNTNVPARTHRRNPTPAQLARLAATVRPVSICSSLRSPVATAEASAAGCDVWHDAATLSSLSGNSSDAEEDVEICEVQAIAVAIKAKAKVVDVVVSPPHVKPVTIIVPRLNSPPTSGGNKKVVRNFSLPSARPESPTLPPAFPAPLSLSKRM